MFLGRYDHQLEEKGRLSIPKKFRSQLEPGCVISAGLDGCLFVYPKTTWEQLIQKVSNLPLTQADARSFSRSLTYDAVEVEIDSVGRILIPDYLRASAKITTNCVVAGALDRIEIWASELFDAYHAQISARKEEIAERLKDAGI